MPTMSQWHEADVFRPHAPCLNCFPLTPQQPLTFCKHYSVASHIRNSLRTHTFWRMSTHWRPSFGRDSNNSSQSFISLHFISRFEFYFLLKPVTTGRIHCITDKESCYISAEERSLLLVLHTLEIWQRKRPRSFFEAVTGLWLRKYIKIITK
jgi:hypothetical protein